MPGERPLLASPSAIQADVIDYDELPQEELDILRLSEDTFEKLQTCRRWKPQDLAWPNNTLDTITSHYGTYTMKLDDLA